MPTVEESVCCMEQEKVRDRKEKQAGIQCVVDHAGFEAVCLNEDVLETAYYSYRQHYGPLRQDDNR